MESNRLARSKGRMGTSWAKKYLLLNMGERKNKTKNTANTTELARFQKTKFIKQ